MADTLPFLQGWQTSQQMADSAQENKLRKLLLDQKTQEIGQTNALNDLYRNAVGADGTVDRAKLLSSAASSGLGSKIPGLQTQFLQQDKAQREADKSRLEGVMQNVQLQGQLLGGVRDEASYQAAKQYAGQNGIDVSKLPANYDPAFIEQAKTRSLTAAQQIEQEWKQKGYDLQANQFTETKRHNQATEDNTRQANALQGDMKTLQIQAAKDKQQEKDQAKQAQVAGAEDALAVVDKALAHPGRETATGKSSVLDPRNFIPGTDAKNFQVVLDQIKGQAFMQAYQNLRGGGQITEVEGKKATDAIARLNTAQSDEEFKTALNDLRGVMAAGYQRLAGKDYAGTGGQPTKTVAAAGAPKDGATGKSKSGKPIVFRNGQWEYQ